MGIRTRWVRNGLAVLVLCVAITACGSTAKQASSTTDSTASTSAAGGTGSGATTAATTAGGGGQSTAAVKVCSTLPTAQASSLSGTTLGSSREQDFAAGNSYTCAYFPSSGVGGFSVTVTTIGGATAYQNTLQTDQASQSVEHPTPVSGLGDKAFSARDGLHVLFGDRLIFVAGLATVPPAKAIVQAVQAKLG